MGNSYKKKKTPFFSRFFLTILIVFSLSFHNQALFFPSKIIPFELSI